MAPIEDTGVAQIVNFIASSEGRKFVDDAALDLAIEMAEDYRPYFALELQAQWTEVYRVYWDELYPYLCRNQEKSLVVKIGRQAVTAPLATIRQDLKDEVVWVIEEQVPVVYRDYKLPSRPRLIDYVAGFATLSVYDVAQACHLDQLDPFQVTSYVELTALLATHYKIPDIDLSKGRLLHEGLRLNNRDVLNQITQWNKLRTGRQHLILSSDEKAAYLQTHGDLEDRKQAMLHWVLTGKHPRPQSIAKLCRKTEWKIGETERLDSLPPGT